ncbi:MAG: hypothetical protein WD361_03115 [Gracilimonas sp.]
MKTSIFTSIPNMLVVGLLALAMSACTLGDVSDELNNNELTAEEMEEASQIIGQSLSDDNDGVFSSLNDALSNVSSDGFTTSAFQKGNSNDHDYSGRGDENNYQYHYDPETGTHTISFERSVTEENFRKNMSALLTYVFTDINGEYISRPRAERERIESIDFTSDKSGNMQNRHRNGEFSRADTFSIDGVSDATAILAIDGKHYGNGTFHGVRGNGNTFQRTYSNKIDFLDIQINKGVVAENGSLDEGVTGTLSYELNMYKNNNGDESTKTVSGTIQMNGDGTALLRFKNVAKMFRIHLQSGIVTDDDAEIEANVIGIDVENNTVSLENDILVIITERTEVEFDDGLNSLQDVQRAIAAGLTVQAEVEGYRNPDNKREFIADEIEFEMGDDDNDDEEDDD